MLRHLDVAPQPAAIRPLRRLWVMEVSHPPLTDFLTELTRRRSRGKIELIRRLGATLGMIHSLRHSGTGDIVAPDTKSVPKQLTSLVRRTSALAARKFAPLPGCWRRFITSGAAPRSDGGQLAGLPPVRIWNSGLMIMDLSRANYSEPLLDLVHLNPRDIGLDTNFFWEYFLQG